MSAPRLEINLGKIQHNTRTLVDRLQGRGISVTGVTKAAPGSPAVAGAMLRGGAAGLGDSRIENIEAMRRKGVQASMTLIRTPMPSQIERVVAHADTSFNTEIEVMEGLSSFARAAGKVHGVVLMVELGDLREGILPADLEDAVIAVLGLPNIALRGIGANLACRSGVVPGPMNMAQLSGLADSIERKLGIDLPLVSGGNSANLPWALGSAWVGRVNNLRLGEAILLGREPLEREPIAGLHTDAISLVAEVIEAKRKPSLPWGRIAQSAFGEQAPMEDLGTIWQVIFALGRQDVDPEGLSLPVGMEILGASSDHLVAHFSEPKADDESVPGLAVGAEVRFQLNYSALLRTMTSRFVKKTIVGPGAAAPLVRPPQTG